MKKPNKEAALGGEAVGRVQDGSEGGICEARHFEEAQERRFRVVSAQTALEAGIGEDAAPARAYEGGAGGLTAAVGARGKSPVGGPHPPAALELTWRGGWSFRPLFSASS